MKQFGYGKYPNIVSAIEFEKMNNAAGPTGGKIIMENGAGAGSVALLHCIGSRDKHQHKYCSRVCCMYALKFAHLAKEKTTAEVYQCYIDMRAYGKGYEEFYQRILEEGVNVIRGKGAEVSRTSRPGKAALVCGEDTWSASAADRGHGRSLHGAGAPARRRRGRLALRDQPRADGFFAEAHPKLRPVETNTDGVFLAGCAQGPRDVPDTVAHAGGGGFHGHRPSGQGGSHHLADHRPGGEKLCSAARPAFRSAPTRRSPSIEDGNVAKINERPLPRLRHVRGRLPGRRHPGPAFHRRADLRPDRSAFARTPRKSAEGAPA